MTHIIMLTGRKGHGKDTVADIIAEVIESEYTNNKLNRIALATPFKELMAKTFSISVDDLNDLKNDLNQIKSDSENPAVDTNMRRILQNFGEHSKTQFGDEVWCQVADRNLCRGINIITDLRLELEKDYFKEKYGRAVHTIKVKRERKLKGPEDEHISEIEVDNMEVDYNISNAGTIEDLRIEVRKVLKEIEKNCSF